MTTVAEGPGHTDQSDYEGLHAMGTTNPDYRFALRFAKRLAVAVRFHGNRSTAPARAAVRYLRLG